MWILGFKGIMVYICLLSCHTISEALYGHYGNIKSMWHISFNVLVQLVIEQSRKLSGENVVVQSYLIIIAIHEWTRLLQ